MIISKIWTNTYIRWKFGLPEAMLESLINIFLEKEMSIPSVLGLSAGERMVIWENLAPSQPFMVMWALGLFVILR